MAAAVRGAVVRSRGREGFSHNRRLRELEIDKPLWMLCIGCSVRFTGN